MPVGLHSFSSTVTPSVSEKLKLESKSNEIFFIHRQDYDLTYIEMAGVIQDLDLEKHRLLNLDAFYFPNFVTVSLNLRKNARRTVLTYFG
jgi:hypothetical protein